MLSQARTPWTTPSFEVFQNCWVLYILYNSAPLPKSNIHEMWFITESLAALREQRLSLLLPHTSVIVLKCTHGTYFIILYISAQGRSRIYYVTVTVTWSCKSPTIGGKLSFLLSQLKPWGQIIAELIESLYNILTWTAIYLVVIRTCLHACFCFTMPPAKSKHY